MNRAYLDDINVTYRPDLWNKDDLRQEIWQEERSRYGFDERETWSLDLTWRLWLYERLQMFVERTIADLTYHTFEFHEQTYTQEQLINMMIERLEFSFSDDYDEWDNEQYEYVHEVSEIWHIVLPAMWW